MKKILIAFAFVAMMCACEKEVKYYVPDDFPKKEFYPYAPYIMGDTVRFTNGDTIISYEVTEAYWMYERGVVKKDGYREIAAKRVLLYRIKGESDCLRFDMSCADRDEFHMYLECGTFPNLVISRYDILLGNSWEKSFDNYAMFREFFDEIMLINLSDTPKALIKKGVGIVWFEDYFGTKWTLVQE